MPFNDIFPKTVDLANSDLAERIERHLVQLVERVVPGANRSTATVNRLELNRDDWTVRADITVVVRNSPKALFPFSATSNVTFVFHIQTGDVSSARLTIKTKGPDFSVDIGKIRSLFDGDFSKALELIPNGGLIKREVNSDYNRIRQYYYYKYGRGNVYFASTRFFRWASLGTAGRWVLQALDPTGTGSKAAMQEAKTEALKERALVQAWLDSKG